MYEGMQEQSLDIEDLVGLLEYFLFDRYNLGFIHKR